jgi:hypothetical protein
MYCYLPARLHSLTLVVRRELRCCRSQTLQLSCCNVFGLKGHNWQESDTVPGALRDRDQGAKNQSIQIAYIDESEAIQNSEMHQQIVWLSHNCIAYLNCLIQNTDQSYCLVGYPFSSDRIAKMAGSPSMQRFQRLTAIVGSGRKRRSDRTSNTIISNSNRS